MWRLIHAVSCLAAACARVNLPSAVYLLLFVWQCSVAPGGGLYRGTSRKEVLTRADKLRAWFTQRCAPNPTVRARRSADPKTPNAIVQPRPRPPRPRPRPLVASTPT